MEKAVIMIAKAIDTAGNGVDYDPKAGAICPFCAQRARVTHTLAWLGDSRKRYHKCVNPQCPLCVIDATITSWQEV